LLRLDKIIIESMEIICNNMVLNRLIHRYYLYYIAIDAPVIARMVLRALALPSCIGAAASSLPNAVELNILLLSLPMLPPSLDV
jgi:anaerobic glycerol-3-phosphate dehydrogenase